MLAESYFFQNGIYKKAEACPEVYTKKGESREICGKEVKRAGKWDPARSLESCGVMVSKDHPVDVETKFNGHRGIYEFFDANAVFKDVVKKYNEHENEYNEHIKELGKENEPVKDYVNGRNFLVFNGSDPGINRLLGKSIGKSIVESGMDYPIDALVKIIEKYNTDGILPFTGAEGCFFSKKEGCHHELLPKEASNLLTDYLTTKGINEAILDGEMFLERCMIGGKETIPNIGKQHEAIAGDHPEMLESCNFAFKLFDIVRLDDKDVSDLPLSERKKVLKKLIPAPINANVGGKSATGKNISIDPIVGKEMTTIKAITDYVCDVTARGEEGVVIKDMDGTYDWRGAMKENRLGWWKLKEMLDIDAEVTKACLGENKKTAQHALRYRNLHLGVCENDDCTKLAPLTDKGASLTITGGDFSGDKKFDKNIHYPIVAMIKSKQAKPIGDEWVHVDDAMAQPEHKYTRDQYEFMAGGLIDPITGKVGLPRCVKLPLHAIILSVIGTEVNPPSGKKKYPVLQGPPKLNILRTDKMKPNDLMYVKNFIT